ncbi:MAG: CoxG family protein [Chloroflexota bacterium]
MLLEIAKTVMLKTPPDDVWTLLSDPAAVAACLPNVRDFKAADEPNRYTTLLVERLGPFQVQIPLTLDVTEDDGARQMRAAVAGDDRGGQARVRGDVTATVRASGEGSVLDVQTKAEVLGRMATLGAVPIRRRGDQIFDQFIANLAARLEGRDG